MQAGLADWQVRRNSDCGPVAPLAFADRKVGHAQRDRTEHIDLGDVGGGWRLALQVLNESVEAFLRAFQENFNSLLAVQHPSRETIGARQTIYERAEADALHHASNSNRTSADHVSPAPGSIISHPPCNCEEAANWNHLTIFD